MSFHLGNRPNPDLCITLAGERLEQFQKYKYLGFVLDDGLQFNHLFSDLHSKLCHLSYI